jgi:hypothetical protein
MSDSGRFKKRMVVALVAFGYLLTQGAIFLVVGTALSWLATCAPPAALLSAAVLVVLALRVRRSLREAEALLGRASPQP